MCANLLIPRDVTLIRRKIKTDTMLFNDYLLKWHESAFSGNIYIVAQLKT